MTPTVAKSLPYVLFHVRDGLYALSSETVREIVILPPVVAIPNVPPEVRGVINLRGKVMQLVDLRVKFGMPSARKELDDLIQLLKDREQDHKNWLTELETCIREKRLFKLARDPHACKFGMWYDRYETENSMLKMALKRMNEPHQIIHATADEAIRLAEQGHSEDALKLLDDRRNHELASLINLFDEARRILHEQHRELAVVLCRGEKRSAITIDQVEAVERITEENIEPMSEVMQAQGGNRQWRIAKRTKTNQTILMLEEAFCFGAV